MTEADRPCAVRGERVIVLAVSLDPKALLEAYDPGAVYVPDDRRTDACIDEGQGYDSLLP